MYKQEGAEQKYEMELGKALADGDIRTWNSAKQQT